MLQAVPVDLAEHAPPGLVEGRESVGPIVQFHGGRLRWKRQIRRAAYLEREALQTEGTSAEVLPYQSLWAAAPGHEAAFLQPMVEALDAACQQEALAASRFKLRRGEALLIDNFRMLHAREGYGGLRERKVWRVWCWTDESQGLPEGLPQVATPLDAAKVR